VSEVQLFLLGFGGSCAAEVIVLYQLYQGEAAFPIRYRKLGFWVVRLLVAVVAGGLVVFYKLTDPIPALHVGIATPLIIQAFARTAP
jgi:hypothetical protein